MRKRNNFRRLLACLLVMVIYMTACAFSLRGQSQAVPDNPIEDLKEEEDSAGKASVLSSYLPKSKEIMEEMGQDEAESPESQTEDARQDEKSENVSDELEGTDAGEGGAASDDAGNGEEGGSGGEGESGTTPQNVRDGDGNAQNYFTTSIIDGETVTEAVYSFTITQLQKEIPLKEENVYVNKKKMPHFNGKISLKEGKNDVRVTCIYKKKGEKQFSVSRSYTVILDTENIVFFTNLEDDSIVSNPNYSFKAYAKYRNEEVPLTVKVNDAECKESKSKKHTYDAALNRDENSIVLTAKTKKGRTETQKYKIHLRLKNAVILTDLSDLADSEITSAGLDFYVSVLDADKGEEHKARVTCNETELSPYSGFNYHVELREGSNVFTVDGSAVSPELSVETYVLYYYPPAEGLEIRTDLEPEMTVNDASFLFYAYARDSHGSVALHVTVNGQPADGNRNHYYSAGLRTNDNQIVLTADNGTDRKVQEYIVTYEPVHSSGPVDGPEDDDDDKDDEMYAPSISSPDLYDGMKVKGSTLTFTVKAVDYQGRRLNAGYLTLKLNGYSSGVSIVWDDSSKTSYRLRLNAGTNELSIKVVDTEGHSKTFLVRILSEEVAAGAPIGKAVFSLDAGVLGIGFLIPPEEVDIYDGENAAFVLDRWLRSHGFTYDSTGSLSSGFYLSRVKKRGLLKNLDESIKSQYGTDSYDENSLGEFDFTSTSGWMYRINGDFPNYGFSDCYLQDGSEVRIRFTLDLGSDIGGGEAVGG